MSACSIIREDPIHKIALLAPFEGRYRSIGYDALYAARLAIIESQTTDIELLALDDGSTLESATDRASALAKDPDVKMVLLMGIHATQPDVQQALDGLPALIIGEWGGTAVTDSSYHLSADFRNELSVPVDLSLTQLAARSAPFTGGELLALPALTKLRDSMANITILSSSSLPDEDFRQRYLESDIFVPEPGLLATLTYDATALSIQAIHAGISLAEMDYTGINGRIRFDKNRWLDALINRYSYDDSGQLILVASQ